MLLQNLWYKKSTFIERKELYYFNYQFKMNKINNTFLLCRDKFMPELHLKQLGFAYSSCRQFTKSCKRIKKFTEKKKFKIFSR